MRVVEPAVPFYCYTSDMTLAHGELSTFYLVLLPINCACTYTCVCVCLYNNVKVQTCEISFCGTLMLCLVCGFTYTCARMHALTHTHTGCIWKACGLTLSIALYLMYSVNLHASNIFMCVCVCVAKVSADFLKT